MSWHTNRIDAKMFENLLVPEDLPHIANPLSGAYLQFCNYNDSSLSYVALRKNSSSGSIEGKRDGIFPYFVQTECPARGGGVVPPIGNRPPFMLETALEKALLYGRKWAEEDGFEDGSYVIAIVPPFSRLKLDPTNPVAGSNEWDVKLPGILGAVLLYPMTDTSSDKTISRRTRESGERILLPGEDLNWMATVDEVLKAERHSQFF
jgi:hypothetical protein